MQKYYTKIKNKEVLVFSKEIKKRMKGTYKMFLFCLILISAHHFSDVSARYNSEGKKVPVGVNAPSVNDYSSAWIFVDAMKRARSWITHTNAIWDTRSAAEMLKDENGYPLELPFLDSKGNTNTAITIIYTGLDGNFPKGEYNVYYEGEGDFLWRGATVIESTPGHIRLNVPESSTQLFMEITRSQLGNHLKNIRIILPGFEDTYEQQIFHPLFLERFKDMRVFRFMDFLTTNANPIENWSERNTPTHYTQVKSEWGHPGVSIEYAIELANRLDVDPWFTIPHAVNDEYVRNFAKMVYENLDSNKSVYVEYSNELWNNGFSQTNWVRVAGCVDPLTTVPFTTGNDWGVIGCEDGQASANYRAMRSIKIFQIFEEEFGSEKSRIIKVHADQAANIGWAKYFFKALDNPNINPTNMNIDALAIAPYFGGRVGDEIFDNGEVDTATVDLVLDRAMQSIDERVVTWVQNYYTLAQSRGVELIAYEGGQHLVANGSRNQNTTLVELLKDANRHPRMEELHDHYFDVWYDNGGGLFAIYSSVREWSRYGSWGLLEFQNSDIETMYKYKSTMNLIQNFVNGPVSDTATPVLSNGLPIGEQVSGTTNVNLTLDTDDNATCKYSTTPNTTYESMMNTFSTTGETSHSTNVTDLTDGSSYTYYVRCMDSSSNVNTSDTVLSFSITVRVILPVTPPTSGGGGGNPAPICQDTQLKCQLVGGSKKTYKWFRTEGESCNGGLLGKQCTLTDGVTMENGYFNLPKETKNAEVIEHKSANSEVKKYYSSNTRVEKFAVKIDRIIEKKGKENDEQILEYRNDILMKIESYLTAKKEKKETKVIKSELIKILNIFIIEVTKKNLVKTYEEII